MVDQEVNLVDERHLVVPLTTEVFLYHAFLSNEINIKGG